MKKENLEIVEFILSEIRRFQQMLLKHDLKSITDDALYMLDGELGKIIYGRKSHNKLFQITKSEYAARSEISKTSDVDLYFQEVRKVFATFFVNEHRQVTEKSVSRMFSSAFKRLKSGYISITHFIPCFLFSQAARKEFAIGPITFLHIALFKERYHQEALEAFADEKNITDEEVNDNKKFPFQSQKFKASRTQLKKRYIRRLRFINSSALLALYKKSVLAYNWIAIVTIAPCEPSYSEKKAKYIIEQGLNIIRLMVGLHNSEHIKQSVFAKSDAKGLSLAKHEGKKIQYNAFTDSDEHHYKNWHSALFPDDGYDTRVLGSILTTFAGLSPLSHLQERLLDALTWYGETTEQEFPGGKIVRLVSALERLTLTGKKDNIGECVIGRTAELIKTFWGDDRKTELSHFSDIRSRLVHGDKSPWDEELINKIYLLGKITRNAIIAATQFFLQISHIKRDSTTKDLDMFYEQFLAKKPLSLDGSILGEKTAT
jgi:hypothetical protein